MPGHFTCALFLFHPMSKTVLFNGKNQSFTQFFPVLPKRRFKLGKTQVLLFLYKADTLTLNFCIFLPADKVMDLYFENIWKFTEHFSYVKRKLVFTFFKYLVFKFFGCLTTLPQPRGKAVIAWYLCQKSYWLLNCGQCLLRSCFV